MRTWSRPAVVVTLSAAGILMVTMGARQSLGLFVSPLNTSTGLGITTISRALAAIGAGAGSFSVLVGAAARHLTDDSRGKAAGIINAGGSFGQFVFAPISQALIQALGWMGAMWSLALITLGAVPLARAVSPPGPLHHHAAGASAPWDAVRHALGDR